MTIGNRTLSNLDKTVVSIPLLEQLEEEGIGRKKIPVIIEINLAYHERRETTKKMVIGLTRKVAGKGSVEVARSADADQYVFASLTRNQIRELARENAAPRDGGAASGNRKEQNHKSPTSRLIYKIWPDFAVYLLLTESVSTVKADAARAAFAATGQDVVWAVIDSGIDGKHPHFKKHANLKLPDPLCHWDFSGNEAVEIKSASAVRDHNGHGTHVAGIIAGELHSTKKTPVRAEVHCRDELGNSRSEHLDLSAIRGIAPECKLVSLRVAR